MITQKHFRFHLNTKSLLHADFEGIHFFWEAGEDTVTVFGCTYDLQVDLSESSASAAKRAMVKFIRGVRNV